MNQKKRLAFFPVYSDTLPVVRYFMQYREDVEVVELISLPGSCVCGKDASILDNRESFGMFVKTPEQANPNNWDELYLLDHDILGFIGGEEHEILNHSMLTIAQKHHKVIRRVEHISNKKTYQKSKKLLKRRIEKLERINIFTVFVGGIIGEANTFEVFLKLYGELSKRVTVSAFSSSSNAAICDIGCLFDLIHEPTLDESDKTIKINSALQNSIKNSDSEVLLIHLEEAMLPYNDSLTNGFGIIPYMVSQILTSDFCICCVPCDCTDTGLINDLSQEIEGRFGMSPDVWHISNACFDHTVSPDLQSASVIYSPIESFENSVKLYKCKDQNIGSLLLDRDYLMQCIDGIINGIQERRIIDIIS